MFRRSTIVLHCVMMITIIQSANSIKCYSCNSKQEKKCLDPFNSNFSANPNEAYFVDCDKEVSTRQFISYFSQLMSSLGVSVNFDMKYALNRIPEGVRPSACQKAEIVDNGELIVIRNCAILSDIVCDTLRNDEKTYSSTAFCEVCDTDYCNSAQKLFIGWNLLCLIVLTNRVIV